MTTDTSTTTSGDAAESFDVHALPGGLDAAIEAIVMVVEEPVTPTQLASALEVPQPDVTAALARLKARYDEAGHGFTLTEIDGGWRVFARHDLAPAVEKFLLDGAQARLTKAALETLAVIAYRQPVSRARIGAVRGVNVDGVVRTLLTRGLITEVGLDAEHGAVLYGTTSFFLQRLGISSLDELPPLAPYLPDIDDVDEPGVTAVGGLSAVMETTGADAPAHPEPVDDEIEQRQQHDDRATREKWE